MKYRGIPAPSPAMIVALIALVVAMGGTSYAAFNLPKNSVGSTQLRKAAVTTAKLKNGAVTTVKLKNGAVTTAKIKNGAVTGLKVAPQSLTGANILASSLGQVPNAGHANTADSATNAAHATAADSATNAGHASTADSATNASQLGGITASSYLSKYQRVDGTPSAFDTNQQKFLPVSCPAGKKLVALGVTQIAYAGTLPAIIPQFTNDTSGEVIAQKYDAMAYSVTPEAVCATG